MSDKGKIIRVLTYICEVIFFTAGVVCMFLNDPSMSLASLAMSEICRLHRNMQDLSIIVAKILLRYGGEK